MTNPDEYYARLGRLAYRDFTDREYAEAQSMNRLFTPKECAEMPSIEEVNREHRERMREKYR